MNLLYVRYRQFLYLIKHLYIYLLLLAGLFLLGIYVIIKAPENNLYYFTGFYLLGLFSIFLKRKDKQFVFVNMTNPYRQFFWEMVVFSIPLFFVQIYAGKILLFLLFFCFIPLTFVKITIPTPSIKENISLRLFLYFSPHYEWQYTIRRRGIFLIIVYVISLGLCWVRIIPLIGLFFILLFIAETIYETEESLTLLRAPLQDPEYFIRGKIKSIVVPWMFLCLTVCLPGVFFYPELWYLYLIFFIYTPFMLVFLILDKYKRYTPVYGKGNPIVLSIALLSPIFFPLILLILIGNFIIYPDCLNNLRRYLC